VLTARKALVVTIALVMTLTAAACRKADSGKVGALQDETIPRKLSLRITGARTFDLSETRDLRILVRTASGSRSDLSVASVSSARFFTAADGWFVQPEVAVVGLYDGDGTYTVPAGRGTKPSTGPTVVADPGARGMISVIQTTFDRMDKPGSAQRYDYALEPCVVRLSDSGKTGSAKCPALAAFDGAVIAMEMTWGKP
jgi:hypothetical protein